MAIPLDEQAKLQLESLGVPPENLFLLTGDDDEGLIALWHPEIGMRFVIIENDVLAKACTRRLLQQGARQFDSTEQLLETASREKWPGWELCQPVRQPVLKEQNS